MVQPQVRCSAKRVIRRLKRGNQQFITNPTAIRERRKTANVQEPCVVIVACSDSRVPPSRLFSDRKLGRFFEVRSAGLVLDQSGIESIRYAVEQLKATTIIVLGHTQCGAVKAAVDGSATNAYPFLAHALDPAVKQARRSRPFVDDMTGLVNATVRQSTVDRARAIRRLFSRHRHSEHVMIRAGVSNLETGRIQWFIGRI